MNRLKQLREERRITQEELAFELNTSQQSISKIERQIVPMGEKMIIRCAKFFGVTADYLLGISDVQVSIEVSFTHPKEIPDAPLRDILSYYHSFDRPSRELLREITKVIANFYHGEDR